MILFTNKVTGKVVSDTLNSIPISITSDVVLKNKIDSKIEPLVNINGDIIYEDGTTEQYRVQPDNAEVTLDMVSIFGDIGTMDEILVTGHLEEKNQATNEVYLIVETPLTESNAIGFDISEILSYEYENLLEQSMYNSIIYNILENVRLFESTFFTYNKYRVILDSFQKIIIDIPNVSNVTELSLFGVMDSGATVFINNIAAVYDSTHKCFNVTIAAPIESLVVEVQNNISKLIELNNPFILFN